MTGDGELLGGDLGRRGGRFLRCFLRSCVFNFDRSEAC